MMLPAVLQVHHDISDFKVLAKKFFVLNQHIWNIFKDICEQYLAMHRHFKDEKLVSVVT